MRYVRNALAAILLLLCVTATRTANGQEGIVHFFTYQQNGGGGLFPAGNLLADTKGNLFGTTTDGGSKFAGTVFELSPTASGGWTEKLIYSFKDSPGDGRYPVGYLIADQQGNLFGLTEYGGSNGDSGTAFELSPHAGGSWTEKVLYNFGASATDGKNPVGNLVFDAQGNLYGATEEGGTNVVSYDPPYPSIYGGTAFELKPSSNGSWAESILYNFGATSTDGYYPAGGFAIDASGKLYGLTLFGGIYYSEGTAYELTRQSDGGWTKTNIHDFGYPVDSGQPLNGLLLDSKGNLFGGTQGGPLFGGEIFELSPAAGGTWTEHILDTFSQVGDGAGSGGTLAMDAAGNLYGTNPTGGNNYYTGRDDPESPGGGAVFELTPKAGGTWKETLLYDFRFPPQPPNGFPVDTSSPTSGITLDSKGNLYGTAFSTVFEIGNPSTIQKTLTSLVASPSTNLTAGEPITLTISVTAANGQAVKGGGLVTLFGYGGVANEPQGVTLPLDSSGKLVYSGTVPPAGTYSLVAYYNGDVGFIASQSAAITETVTSPPK